MKKASENLQKIKLLIKQWEMIPLFTRKSEGSDRLLDIKNMTKSKEERYTSICSCSEEIQKLMAEIAECFLINKRIKPTSRRWRSYLRHVDASISDALLYTIATSVGYLLDQTDINKEPTPLFEISLELFHPDIIYNPALDDKKMHNFFDITKDVVDSIYQMAALGRIIYDF